MEKVENLNEEVETLKIENVKLSEKNDELLAHVNGMLQWGFLYNR